jgi:hypothetical protein
MNPQNGSADVPPPPAPPPVTQDSPAPAPADAQYASGEYAVGENADAYDDDDPAALTDFHGTLDPYGTWVDDGTYGTVWVPASTTVGADFTPYTTAGHWVYDDDWVWASDYPWGWAPFHYGRWVLIEGRGWAWIPGRVYRGAWVGWSVDDGYSYVGWAPLGPEFVWFGGRPVVWRGYLAPRWVYCGRAEVFAPSVGSRVIVGPAAARLSGQMRPFFSASPGVAGPAPTRLGYSSSQVPRPTGTAAQSLSRAQAFSRPSTARAVGGTPPMRSTPLAAGPPSTGSRPAPDLRSAPRGTTISTERTPPTAQTTGEHVTTSAPAARPSVPGRAPAPAYRPSTSPSHSGGGHHR